ncbi:MAG: hypothetical protein IJA74_02890 [Oscillospiraceae bacterium]|nr:hypothetical protein [Oscillospiraceae bacterium]
MGDCKSCAGGCGGCKKELVLSQGEIDLLRALGQYSFLPVARKADDMTPVYLEDDAYSQAEYSLIIQLLEQKHLVNLDYTPLSGAKMGQYKDFPVHGSMALTERGQQVLELLELQGAEE